ncbi:PadR family transcriptional regulator [Paenibacillus donghaensis]|uniref:PadR family transcriptional regulator n=1 Tax=Paenibacillus donghaensis TaxID=414771 RepID=A0A2Z2K7S5_9BACL|nr:PadR family transcriptional regulator [Paenibacillus donghaensis]ASA21167.1 hypothetical protein B9T62_10435 [Paenibacillus donghaensis]
MAKTSNTLFAVLGVLTKGPCSGYDIRKHFSESLRHFWSESYGQIYPALKEIVAQGYAAEVSYPNHSRKQKKYEITNAGLEHFSTWLASPVNPLNYRDELLLRVFFARPKDAPALAALFEREQTDLTQSIAAYKQQEAELLLHKHQEQYPFWSLTLRYGLLSSETRLQWCREALLLLARIPDEDRKGETK